MKKYLIIVFAVFLLVGCKSTKVISTTEKEDEISKEIKILDKSDYNLDQKSKAYSLGKRVLLTCNTSRFKPFSADEAVESVRKNTTVEKLTATCQKFKLRYGNFKEIYLAQVLYDPRSESTIYRYKAEYERKHTQKELRVTMNKENKVSSIKSTDWVETIL